MPRRRSTVPVNAETTGSRKPTNKVSNVESSDRSDPGFAGVRSPKEWASRKVRLWELAPCENTRVVDEAKKRRTVGPAAHSPEAPGAAPGAAAADPRTRDDSVDVLPVRAAHVQRVRDPERAALPGEVRSGAERVDERVRQRDESAGAAHRVDNGDAVHARCVESAPWTVAPALARETVGHGRGSAFPRDGPPHGSRETKGTHRLGFLRFFFRSRVVFFFVAVRAHL